MASSGRKPQEKSNKAKAQLSSPLNEAAPGKLPEANSSPSKPAADGGTAVEDSRAITIQQSARSGTGNRAKGDGKVSLAAVGSTKRTGKTLKKPASAACGKIGAGSQKKDNQEEKKLPGAVLSLSTSLLRSG